MAGRLFGVGVGPGDPELMTVKAVHTIKKSGIIAVPDSRGSEQVALNIARDYIDGKEIITLDMPMTKDREIMKKSHMDGAETIIAYLDKGVDVSFLTLGDAAVYSTYLYIHEIVLEKGYQAEIIPGITSFSSAAARLNIGLCMGREPLHIIPASYDDVEGALNLQGTKVLMKSGRKSGEVIDKIKKLGMADNAYLVERCCMDGEKVVKGLRDYKGDNGYFTTIIVKDSRRA